MKKRLSLYVMCALYLLAGINHFRRPEGYYAIIPGWLGDAAIINVAAGIAELTLAVMLFFKLTRKWACYGIIIMLLAFIPSHIYMLHTGFCPEIEDTIYCVPHWLLWVRLIVVQPLLVYWAWKVKDL